MGEETEGMVDYPNGVVEAVEVVEPIIEEEQEKPFSEMTNAEFCAFPENDVDENAVSLIAVRAGSDGQVYYRVWGFRDGGQLEAMLAATTHLGGAIATERQELLKRLQAVVGAAVGR